MLILLAGFTIVNPLNYHIFDVAFSSLANRGSSAAGAGRRRPGRPPDVFGCDRYVHSGIQFSFSLWEVDQVVNQRAYDAITNCSMFSSPFFRLLLTW